MVWFHPGAQSTCYCGALSLLSYVIAFSYHLWLSQAKLHLSSFSLSLLSPSKGLALREVEIELAVEAQKAGGVLLLREPVHVDNVLLPRVPVGGVGEADLVVEVVDKAEGLQVAVELVHLGQGHLGQGLDQVAHGNVIGESHPIPDLGEPALACQPPHLLRQRLAQAESGTTSGKPEGDSLLQKKKGF